jgi:hypothetical protein
MSSDTELNNSFAVSISRVYTLEQQIADIKERLDKMRRLYEENTKIINGLEPKIGQKRKRFWLEF